MQAAEPGEIRVGRLGWMQVVPGFYLYAGSAFGPGGLRARLARHFAEPVIRHWHIDYLRLLARPVEAWAYEGPEKFEHAFAAALRSLPGASQTVRGFGASDCRCPSHLVYFLDKPDSLDFKSALIQTGFPQYNLYCWLTEDFRYK